MSLTAVGPQQLECRKCVHCCCTLTEVTDDHLPTEIALDHVFPRAWYPDTTPEQIQRWKVPCCRQCNGVLGKAEQEVFVKLALCLDPRTGAAAGLSEKAMRSMGIGVDGLRQDESKHRRALKKKVIDSMWRYEPGAEPLPGLGPPVGFPEEDLMAISIPAALINQVAEKMVRGSEYVLAKQVIEKPYGVSIHFVHRDKVPEQVSRPFRNVAAQTTNLGPGFSVERIAAHDEPAAAMYKIVVWGTLDFYAAILRS